MDTIFSKYEFSRIRYKYKGKIHILPTVPIIFLTGGAVQDCTMTLV